MVAKTIPDLRSSETLSGPQGVLLAHGIRAFSNASVEAYKRAQIKANPASPWLPLVHAWRVTATMLFLVLGGVRWACAIGSGLLLFSAICSLFFFPTSTAVNLSLYAIASAFVSGLAAVGSVALWHLTVMLVKVKVKEKAEWVLFSWSDGWSRIAPTEVQDRIAQVGRILPKHNIYIEELRQGTISLDPFVFACRAGDSPHIEKNRIYFAQWDEDGFALPS